MRKVAFYGGSFDPVHKGHIMIAEKLIDLFEFDDFVFIPAFHAPHKRDTKPASAYDRYAMLVLATSDYGKTKVSKIELESPDEPYTIQTLCKLRRKMVSDQIFFVMGADSWQEITTWRDWERVLTEVNIVVVTRPNYQITFEHVTEKIRFRIRDIRGQRKAKADLENRIYITDVVQMEASATQIREMVKSGNEDWKSLVTKNVADYIVKYKLYLE